jgi:methionine sulfoxide reductase heme-binding subunit
MTKNQIIRRIIKPGVFVSCFIPLMILGWDGYRGTLSANPISDITNTTGIWTLRFVLITLSITPLRKILRISDLIKFRRMFGLFAFFYGCLHFTTYIWLDQFFDWQSIVQDIPKRPFILVGFTGFSLMIPLAITSTKKMIRRLGGKRWNLIHRLIYVTGICGVIHYMWKVKVIQTPQIIYAVILGVLLLLRVLFVLFPKGEKLSQQHAEG